MKNILVIKQGRILLEESVQNEKMLSLKICVGTNIHKFDHLQWSQPCQRWETTQEIKINYLKGQSIQLQLYYPSKNIPKVVGQATIDMGVFSQHLEEELKIALTYDGMIKGWLYCQIGMEGQGPLKIETFHFLEDFEKEFCLQIFQNTEPIYQKKFLVTQTSKMLFPNLKYSIRYSDVIRICINHGENKFKTISFLVDSIKRGKTAFYQTWLRNKYNNKSGDVKVEYFLENLFLENDRSVVSRKIVFPKTLSRMSSLITQANKTHTTAASLQSQQTSNVIKEVQQAQIESEIYSKNSNKVKTSFKVKRKQQKIVTSLNHGNKVGYAEKENMSSSVKMEKSPNAVKIKQKGSFYFQLPFQSFE